MVSEYFIIKIKNVSLLVQSPSDMFGSLIENPWCMLDYPYFI